MRNYLSTQNVRDIRKLIVNFLRYLSVFINLNKGLCNRYKRRIRQGQFIHKMFRIPKSGKPS